MRDYFRSHRRKWAFHIFLFICCKHTYTHQLLMFCSIAATKSAFGAFMQVRWGYECHKSLQFIPKITYFYFLQWFGFKQRIGTLVVLLVVGAYYTAPEVCTSCSWRSMTFVGRKVTFEDFTKKYLQSSMRVSVTKTHSAQFKYHGSSCSGLSMDEHA